MAELAVRMHYVNQPRKLTLSVMKLTFPIWGIAAPVTSLFVILPIYFSYIANHTLTSPEIVGLSTGCALLFTFFTFLLTFNWLTRDAVIIDKDGVKLPFSLLRWNAPMPWQNIKKIQVGKAADYNWKKKEITFITSSGAPRKLGLSHMPAEDVEKLLLALEMWGSKTEIDSSILTLKDDVAGTASPGQLSYTDMWEDELGRRFNPTAFVPLEPGRMMRNGTLKVIRHLALGGLSAVYLCQLDDRKLVVLKEAVVSDDAVESAQAKAREMLDREAALLLKLGHPNIVKVMDYFVEQGRNYLMLEYINGQDLRQLVKQNGPQRESTVLGWALQMATILKYLHEQDPPLVHRDFTPDNLVLCEDGSIVVIDFGAANEFIGSATGTFVGKHAFIAPEQFRGKACVQSDIYAFGCTLHYLLTGNEPEALSTSNPAQENSRISSELNQLVVACTQLETRDRYQSAAQLLPVLRGLSAAIPSAN
ncbi:MAG TPA: serine/threonine-protein kinase [Trichormus sp.]|jgi:tRNA A-37 threonylcarbamoyl transferase component Bud32